MLGSSFKCWWSSIFSGIVGDYCRCPRRRRYLDSSSSVIDGNDKRHKSTHDDECVERVFPLLGFSDGLIICQILSWLDYKQVVRVSLSNRRCLKWKDHWITSGLMLDLCLRSYLRDEVVSTCRLNGRLTTTTTQNEVTSSGSTSSSSRYSSIPDGLVYKQGLPFPFFTHSLLTLTQGSRMLIRNCKNLVSIIHPRSPKALKTRHPLYAGHLPLFGDLEGNDYYLDPHVLEKFGKESSDTIPTPHDISMFDLCVLILSSRETLENIDIQTFDTNPLRVSYIQKMKCPKEFGIADMLRTFADVSFEEEQTNNYNAAERHWRDSINQSFLNNVQYMFDQHDDRDGNLCSCWETLFDCFSNLVHKLCILKPHQHQPPQLMDTATTSACTALCTTTTTLADDITPIQYSIATTDLLSPGLAFTNLKVLKFRGWALSSFLAIVRAFKITSFPNLEVLHFRGLFLVSPSIDWGRVTTIHQSSSRVPPRPHSYDHQGGLNSSMDSPDWKKDTATAMALLLNPFCKNYANGNGGYFWHSLFAGESVWTQDTFPKLRDLSLCVGDFDNCSSWMIPWIHSCFAPAPICTLEVDHTAGGRYGVTVSSELTKLFTVPDNPPLCLCDFGKFQNLKAVRIRRSLSLCELWKVQSQIRTLLGHVVFIQTRKIHVHCFSPRFPMELAYANSWAAMQKVEYQRVYSKSPSYQPDFERHFKDYQNLLYDPSQSTLVLDFDHFDPWLDVSEDEIAATLRDTGLRELPLSMSPLTIGTPSVQEVHFHRIAKIILRFFTPTSERDRMRLWSIRFNQRPDESKVRRVVIHLEVPKIWEMTVQEAQKSVRREVIKLKEVLMLHEDLHMCKDVRMHPVPRLTCIDQYWSWWKHLCESPSTCGVDEGDTYSEDN